MEKPCGSATVPSGADVLVNVLVELDDHCSRGHVLVRARHKHT